MVKHRSPKARFQVRVLVGPPSLRRSSQERSRVSHSSGVAKPAFSTTKSIFDVVGYNKYMYYVYSLKCKDGFYVGCTDDLKDRMTRHEKGHVPATKDRLPIKLDFYFAIPDKYKAFEFEKYLKSGSGRAFIKKRFLN